MGERGGIQKVDLWLWRRFRLQLQLGHGLRLRLRFRFRLVGRQRLEQLGECLAKVLQKVIPARQQVGERLKLRQGACAGSQAHRRADKSGR